MFKEKIRIQLLGGSLTDHGSYTDGNYQGYPVVITTESAVYHVRINAVSAQDPDNTQLAQYLEYQKQNVKHLVDYSCTSTSVLLTIKMPAVNGNKVPDMINSVVDPLRNLLPLSDQKGCPGYVQASLLLFFLKLPVPEDWDQYYTAGLPHPQTPVLLHTGSPELRL